MNCNDCGGFLPGGCECSPFGGRAQRTTSDGTPTSLFEYRHVCGVTCHPDAKNCNGYCRGDAPDAGVYMGYMDPLNIPLPEDVKVGATTFRKGVPLRTFVSAAQRWHREAFPDYYTLTDEEKAANLARLQSAAPKGQQ